MPNVQRNYGGFDYSNYLKTLEIYGTINAENIEILKHNNLDRISIKINEYRQNIKDKISNTLDSKVWPIYFSLILADSSYIEKDIRDDFANCSLSHILAVSGMHISYIIIGVSVLLNKILGKRCGRIVTIIVLILYTVLTGFTPSLARAIIMGIMTIISNLIYRRNDTWNFLFFSLFCILIYNPYLITNIGLQYSYIATIGIIIFNKHILKILNKRSNKLKKIKESISVLISAQIALFPLIIFHTNKFGIYFIITNLIVGFIIGPIIILGFIFLIVSILNFYFSKFLSPVVNFLIKTILFFSGIGKFPLAKIYVKTPSIWEIMIYYIFVFIISFLYKVKNDKTPNNSFLRVRWILAYIKYKYKIKKILTIYLITSIVLTSAFVFVNPIKLEINIVDVSQGDACFIITPQNKTILIDGGGSKGESFDVGKSTLLPYILDKGYTSIDYIFISHFDSDHVRRNFIYYGRNIS